jgi:hypothetical protein
VSDKFKNGKQQNIKLDDLLILGPLDIAYLVHDSVDVGFIFAGGLAKMTDQQCEDYADLLNAQVVAIRAGAYGPEIVLKEVDPQLLMDYDQAAADLLRQQQPKNNDASEDEDCDMGMQMQ